MKKVDKKIKVFQPLQRFLLFASVKLPGGEEGKGKGREEGSGKDGGRIASAGSGEGKRQKNGLNEINPLLPFTVLSDTIK